MLIDDLIEDLLHVDPHYQSDIDFFCSKYYCILNATIFKSKDLQYEYEYDIELTNTIRLDITIESGINNGTKLRHINYMSNVEEYLLKVLREHKIKELLNP